MLKYCSSQIYLTSAISQEIYFLADKSVDARYEPPTGAFSLQAMNERNTLPSRRVGGRGGTISAENHSQPLFKQTLSKILFIYQFIYLSLSCKLNLVSRKLRNKLHHININHLVIVNLKKDR
jgi:hypothetical protein